MKSCWLILLLLLLFTSCGALRVSPVGCKTDGVWSESPNMITKTSSKTEIDLSEDFFVLGLDKEVRLRDFLYEKGIACQYIRSLHIEIDSLFFVMRKLNVFIVK